MTGVVLGVVGLNAVFAAVGYAVLAAGLKGLSPRALASWAGVALLVGAALVGVALCGVAAAGGTTGPTALGAVAGILVAGGLAAAILLPGSPPTALAQAPPPLPRAAAAVATAAAFGLAAVALAVLVGGFRTSPWLDDTWFFWLPKGLALDAHGLDPHLFVRNDRYVSLQSEPYPLWWPVVTSLDVRFGGEVDLRAVNGQLAILTAAFLGAAARLLWRRVRPHLLFPGLLLLACSPELLRQAQGGGADLPLAYMVALSALAASLWVSARDRLALFLAFAFAAAAVQIKEEGIALVAIFLVAFGLFALRRAVLLWGALALGAATSLPWFLWRREHAVGNPVSFGEALSRIAGFEGAHEVGVIADRLAYHLTNPREWLIAVPLALLLALAVAVGGRSPRELALPLGLGAAYLFWIAVYWGNNNEDVEAWLGTSAYRVVDSLVVVAAVFSPLLAERALSVRAAPAPSAEGSGAAAG